MCSLAHGFNARYQLLCISLLFRNSRKPLRPEPVARPLLSAASVSFLLRGPPSSRQPGSRAFLTRRDVLLMKMKELLIFSLPAESAGVLSPILLSFLRGSLPSEHHCFHFPRRRHPPSPSPRDAPHRRPFSSFYFLPFARLGSPSLPPLLAAVILLSVYRTGLRGMRQRALREINSDWYHACLGKPSWNLRRN